MKNFRIFIAVTYFFASTLTVTNSGGFQLNLMSKAQAGAGEALTGIGTVGSSVGGLMMATMGTNTLASKTAEGFAKKCSINTACKITFISIAVMAAGQAISAGSNRASARQTAIQAGCTSAQCLGLSGTDFKMPDLNIPEFPKYPDYSPKDIEDFQKKLISGQEKYTPAEKAMMESAQKISDGLAKQGYKFDPATGKVTTPNGSFNASSLSSPAAMAKAGFTPEQIKSFADFSKKMEGLNEKVAKAFGQGSGLAGSDFSGGGEDSSAAEAALGSESDFAGANFQFRNPAAGLNPNGSRGVAGLQKQLDGVTIGVSGDNIFEMISRSYSKQSAQNLFLKGP